MQKARVASSICRNARVHWPTATALFDLGKKITVVLYKTAVDGPPMREGTPRQLQAVSFNRISGKRVICAQGAVREWLAQPGPVLPNVKVAPMELAIRSLNASRSAPVALLTILAVE